jgi:hypothetical protein
MSRMIRAAVLSTLLLHGADAVERRLLRKRPAYDVDRMGKRLFGSARAGRALRWVYGPALALVQQKLELHPLLFGPAIAAGELWLMPRAGATPPVRKWRRGEIPLLFAHATAFALAVHALHRIFDAAPPPLSGTQAGSRVTSPKSPRSPIGSSLITR